MNHQLEILDIGIDEVRSDIVPLYAKANIPDNAFLEVAKAQLAEVNDLPVDFLKLANVVRIGQYDGVFGVIKNEYDVSYAIQDGDKKTSRKTKDETISFFESIYSGHGNVPDAILEDIKAPSETNWMENGMKKVGYISQQKAEFLIDDINMRRSSADIAKDKLKEIIKNSSRYEGSWHYVSETAAVKKVRSLAKPRFVQLAIRYFEWEYKGQTGFCYYLPTHQSIVSKDLPEDATLKAELKKLSKWEDLVIIMASILVFVAIGFAIYLGFHGMKWYKCLLWGFVMVMACEIPMFLGMDMKERREKRLKKLRLEQSKLHF